MTFRAFNIKKLKINCFVFCLFVFSIMCLFCLWRILWLARQQQNLWRNMPIINKRWKKKYPATFFNKMSSMEFGFDLSHCKKKICTSKCLKLLIVTVDTKMFQTDFFLLTSEEFRLTIGTLSEFEDWMSMTLRIYSLNRKYPQFLFYNSFGKNIISKLYTSWLLTIATICYKVDGLGFWIIGKKPVLIVIFSSKGKVNINRRKW